MIKQYVVVLAFTLNHRPTKEIVKKLVRKEFLAKDEKAVCDLVDRAMDEFRQDAKYKGFDLIKHEVIGVIGKDLYNDL